MVLERQPSWSDVPIVMLIQGGVQSPAANRVLGSLRNVMLLERPAPTRSVLSAVRAALRARERQYQIRGHLAQLIAGERERQLLLESERAARQEAERASRLKDEFLATLSHEVRTPLSAIFGWTQLLKLDLDNRSKVAEAIEVIDRNVRLQMQLIDDLLDMSRIIGGKIRLEVQQVELADVIAAAIEVVRPAAEAKQIRIDHTIDRFAVPVMGDPGRLQQVFWTLLNNAIKFTPRNGNVHVSVKPVASQMEIRVSDDGEGIDLQFLPRIFQRFSQAEGSLKRIHGGLGLGLSIVKSLVELHGGKIRAESPGKGAGSTFIIDLPIQAIRADDTLSSSQLPSASDRLRLHSHKLRGVKVLVVDDEADARELVKRFLVESRAIPVLAASAQEARQLCESFAPDVIVSDIGMPHEDGYEFIRRIRNAGLNTPAIALTAFARDDDRRRSVEAGYQAHLPKPVEPAELLAVVASLAPDSQSE
jgi:signal transduction histidine kinase/CheY-like chemotaxis protein